MTQKNSTKDTGIKFQKKESRRSKEKYPALQPKYNLRMRQDYIEASYANGVYNTNGERVIRPLNNEEKKFLNAYYEEVVGANFLHDKELKNLHGKLKVLKAKNELTKEEAEEYTRIQLEYYARADEVLLYPDHEDQKKLYGENNARNRCVYNRSKSIGILDELNDRTYDEFHNNVYNNPKNAEALVINTFEARTKLRKKDDKDK